MKMHSNLMLGCEGVAKRVSLTDFFCSILLILFALSVYCANAEGSQMTVFRCVQYDMNTQLSSLDVAKIFLADSGKWKSAPVTNTCTAIAFMDACAQA